ncbi:MAG TPA: imidazoleglycerol-phosphate dehydratase, partial [Geoalkalibacter subterraneus]|nr:imidazoleglycerol-phosphate dehydratase [Geoalkalibacter subterraneus]
MARSAMIERKTRETDIQVNLELDGSGKHEIESPVPFFDHMLTQIARHGFFDLEIRASGDIEIDAHHT